MHYFRVIAIFILKFQIALLSNLFINIEKKDDFYKFYKITIIIKVK